MSSERPIRTLIADDEAPSRDLLRQLLSTESDFEIVAECGDGAAALAAAERKRPDLVFLDIRMPHVDGIRAAASIDAVGPVIVFVTAHDEHALAAYEARGFDYVMKPVNKRRFREVIGRIRQEVRKRRVAAVLDDGADGFLARVAGRSGSVSYLDSIRVRSGQEIKYLAADDVVWIEGANQYVNVHALQGTFLLSSETLASLENKLNPRIFFRVHRSAIVNRAHVAGARSDGSGAVFLTLMSGAQVRLSRRYKGLLADLLTTAHR